MKGQRGVAAVEFALVSAIFFTMLLGVIEMGRLLWTWNAATEATRLGARIAIVCDPYTSKAMIVDHMRTRLPTLEEGKVIITYQGQNPPADDNMCDSGNCKAVNVKLTGYTHDTIIPFVPLSLTLPPFSTTQRKEFMQTAANDLCVAPA
jgi:Flp pilus assembly protein TadG